MFPFVFCTCAQLYVPYVYNMESVLIGTGCAPEVTVYEVHTQWTLLIGQVHCAKARPPTARLFQLWWAVNGWQARPVTT